MLFVVVAFIIHHYHYTATLQSLLRGELKLFKMLVLQVVDNSNEKKKILFQLLGCPRNFVDTEVMLGIFLENVVLAACNNDVFLSTCSYHQSHILCATTTTNYAIFQ